MGRGEAGEATTSPGVPGAQGLGEGGRRTTQKDGGTSFLRAGLRKALAIHRGQESGHLPWVEALGKGVRPTIQSPPTPPPPGSHPSGYFGLLEKSCSTAPACSPLSLWGPGDGGECGGPCGVEAAAEAWEASKRSWCGRGETPG